MANNLTITDEVDQSDVNYELAKRIVDNMQANGTIHLTNYPAAIKAVIVTLRGEKSGA